MILIRQIIGATAFALEALLFVLADIWGHLAVEPFVRLFPGRREWAIRNHYRINRNLIFVILRGVGRAQFDVRHSVPCEGGILIVSNHQSLLDIPVTSLMVQGSYPHFVTHYRYATGIPLVSPMIRLMGAIPVYPGRTGKAELDRLAEIARAATHPIILYPEGHRTRDGEIRAWKRGALDAFLSAREWTVHVVVIDGLWQAARIPDFIRTLTRVRCRVEAAGVFQYDGRGRETHEAFVEQMRAAMCDKLSQMRRPANEAHARAATGRTNVRATEPSRNP